MHRLDGKGLRIAGPNISPGNGTVVAGYTPQDVEEITGVPAADIERAAHIFGESNASSMSWGLGVTEHLYGSEVVQLICNVALMTGNVGRLGLAAEQHRNPVCASRRYRASRRSTRARWGADRRSAPRPAGLRS